MAEFEHRGRHLSVTLARAPGAALESRIVGILDSADDGGALAELLAGEGLEFAIVQRIGRLMRAQLGGFSLCVSVERADGTTVLFAAPASPAWSTIVESDVVLVDVVDATGDDSPPEITEATIRMTPRTNVTRTARLEFDDGSVVPLGGTALLGRSPRVERADSAAMPVLVPVHDTDGSISRTHLKVSIEHGRVLLEDLNSTNGTVVIPAEGEPRRLEPGVPAELADGMVVSIAASLAFRVVRLP